MPPPQTPQLCARLLRSLSQSGPDGSNCYFLVNALLPLIFYGSIRFVFETAFISEQIAENRFGALLENRDKFITKFNIFSNMILQLRLKTVWKI